MRFLLIFLIVLVISCNEVVKKYKVNDGGLLKQGVVPIPRDSIVFYIYNKKIPIDEKEMRTYLSLSLNIYRYPIRISQDSIINTALNRGAEWSVYAVLINDYYQFVNKINEKFPSRFKEYCINDEKYLKACNSICKDLQEMQVDDFCDFNIATVVAPMPRPNVQSEKSPQKLP
jgi:hypothetical protein